VSNYNKKLGLFTSCSFAALLMGVGVPAAWAGQCQINDVGVSPPMVSNAGAINCINIQNSTVFSLQESFNSVQATGDVTNTSAGVITTNGTVPPTRTGITINNSTLNGAVINQGTINAHSSPSGIGIFVESNAVLGGISNSGTITAKTGITINNSTINGSIVDDGTILASSHSILIDSTSRISASAGIVVSAPALTGGISNAGTISGGNGIFVRGLTSFSGGISNSGTISGGGGGGRRRHRRRVSHPIRQQ
jgi:hypothetical protein